MPTLVHDSQTNVYQLIKFGAAALVQVSAACVALAHQVSQCPECISTGRFTHALEAQHPLSFAVDVLCSLVELETLHWGMVEVKQRAKTRVFFQIKNCYI